MDTGIDLATKYNGYSLRGYVCMHVHASDLLK
jgi:hypothetical protein